MLISKIAKNYVFVRKLEILANVSQRLANCFSSDNRKSTKESKIENKMKGVKQSEFDKWGKLF